MVKSSAPRFYLKNPRPRSAFTQSSKIWKFSLALNLHVAITDRERERPSYCFRYNGTAVFHCNRADNLW